MSKRWITWLLAGVMALGLAGCGNGSSGGTSDGTAGETQQAVKEEKSTDSMNVATYLYKSEPLLDWDPSVEFSNGIVTFSNVYETLVFYDANTDKVEPRLATEYECSEDGLTWTFKIREGVKFHDGTDLNAEAVKFSIDRTMEKGMGASFIWDPVQEVKVIDDYTVEFDLKYPAALDLIAATGYAAYIYSPASVEGYGDAWPEGAECGTGPYVIQGFTPSKEIILSRFEEYWRDWKDNQFDKVVISKVEETATRRQTMEKGDGDITYALPAQDIEEMKQNQQLEITPEGTMQNVILFLNTEKAPLDNLKVRQALAYAYPYEDVVNYAVGGYAKQSVGVIPRTLWGHDDNLLQYSYDLDKAQALLDESGVDPSSINLLLTYTSGDEAIKKGCELFKTELAKLGISLELRAMSWETQWEMAKGAESGRQDIFVMYWWPDTPSPYTWLKNLYYSEETPYYNMNYYSNSDLDAMVDEANVITATDRDAAAKIYSDAQKLILDDCVSIFAYDIDNVWVTNKTFQGHVDNAAYPDVVFFYDCYRGE